MFSGSLFGDTARSLMRSNRAIFLVARLRSISRSVTEAQIVSDAAPDYRRQYEQVVLLHSRSGALWLSDG